MNLASDWDFIALARIMLSLHARHNRTGCKGQFLRTSAGRSRRASFLSALQNSRMPELLYLIDVYSLVFQVFHAIPEMTSPHGMPTNAVFGFTRDILNILRQKKPTHLICATDPSGPGERENLYPQYKANRSARRKSCGRSFR